MPRFTKPRPGAETALPSPTTESWPPASLSRSAPERGGIPGPYSGEFRAFPGVNRPPLAKSVVGCPTVALRLVNNPTRQKMKLTGFWSEVRKRHLIFVRSALSRRLQSIFVAVCTSVSILAHPAPELPTAVKIIVPFSAGGVQDALAREIARQLAVRTGISTVVENRPGAGGNIGTDLAAKASPNGSVLALSSSGPLANNRWFYRSMPYEPERDLTPVAMVGEAPLVIIVRRNLNVPDLGALLRHRGQGDLPLNFGSAGVGTTSHLALDLMREKSARPINPIPYKGGSQVEIDVMASVLDGGVVLFSPSVLSAADEGRIRILSVTSTSRLLSAPSIPTVLEEGFPMLVTSTWFALVGPRGLRPEYVERMNREVNHILQTPAMIERLRVMGISPISGAPGLVNSKMVEEKAKWAPVVRQKDLIVD